MRSAFLVLQSIVLALVLASTGQVFAKEPVLAPILRAGSVAMSDFSQRIKKVGLFPVEYEVQLSSVSGYDIGLSEGSSAYIVVFLPKKTKLEILGGGAEYWISKSDLSIVKVRGYK